MYVVCMYDLLYCNNTKKHSKKIIITTNQYQISHHFFLNLDRLNTENYTSSSIVEFYSTAIRRLDNARKQ